MFQVTAPNHLRPALAIVGASARSAAASAWRAGFQPITADLFADADLREVATATRISPYPDGMLDWLRTVEPPAWMYTGALENYAELVDQMAWVAPLWGNSGDVLARVRSPWELARVLGNAGLLFPETRASAENLPHNGSWLAKTCRGASGSGVAELVEVGRVGDKETKSLHADAPAGAARLVYQRKILGVPCAGVFVAANGRAALLGITRQLVGEAWLGSHGFQYAGSIGPWPVSETSRAAIEQVGNTLAEQFELMGLFGIDMVLEGERVWTLEVNPRYTASVEIVERTTGIAAIAAHAAACHEGGSTESAGGNQLQSTLRHSSAAQQAHGKSVLYARRDIVLSDEFAAMALAEAKKVPWPTLADVSPPGTPIETGRPVLTLFAEAANVDAVEERLRTRVAELERILYAGS